MDATYDVVVVGGGAAGLSGALALTRARRSVLVVDDGKPRNAPAALVHNYLGWEGTPPRELTRAGRDEVARYGGHVVAGRARAATRDDGGFVVTMGDGHRVRARRLLLATGLVDELPDVPGLAGRWGRDVLHCPYCHGWDVRDQRIGVLATGPRSRHQALLWRQWSPHVMFLVHDDPTPYGDEAAELAARGIPVVDGPVAALEVVDDRLTGVRLADGETIALDALVVSPRFTARAGIAESLGLTTVDAEMGGAAVGSQVPADATAVPGVWVAGNVADVAGHVIGAAAAGQRAAAAINADLVVEDTREAVAAYRCRMHTMVTEAAWEERYRSKESVWSGRPNPQLVAEAADLTPGRALDVGCGEGADAIWLAEQGWRVTAVDISRTALQRAETNALAAGDQVVGRIEWRHADLRQQPLGQDRYDLVSSQFMQLPYDVRTPLFARLADAVAPGGILLIVGHHPSDLRTSAHRCHMPDMMYTAEEVASTLDPAVWVVVAAQARARTSRDPDNREITIHDAVLVALRHD